jgi:transglutaminase-like putative cysteine protease
MIAGLISTPGRLAAVRGAPAAAATLVVALTSATSPLPALARNIAFGFIVLSLLFAFVPKRDNVRTHGGVVFGIVAVAVSGYARTGPPYQIACGLFAIVVIATLRAPLVAARLRGASLASTRQEPAPRHLALGIIAIVATAVTASLLTVLPPASRFAEAQVQRMAGDVMSANDQVGFSTSIRVGSLTNMLRSDRVVMRVSGERTEYLRGAVLDRYEFRVWTSTQAKKTVPLTTDAPPDRATTRIELSRAALSGRTPDPRWFLPSDACDLHTPSGHINIDPHGSAHPDPPGNAREVSFRLATTSTCTAPLPAPLAPNVIDLGIIRKYDADLARIAHAWSKDAVTSQAKLEAMIEQLSHFTYSLEDRREGSEDPVFEFLERTHRGHCELFASALALLARSIGIPTRLVVGYRVDEINSFTGLAVVRDRNAHTWIDAWVGDHWQSFDPTPTSELLASTKASGWENVGEAISVAYDRTVGFFASITLLTYGIVSTVAAVVLIVVRRFMQRRRSVGQAVALISRPLPAFETLATALERAGWARIPSEPLERFARRVDGAGEPWSAEVADALDRYAELRYGGIGEERTVAQRLDDLARKIAPSS